MVSYDLLRLTVTNQIAFDRRDSKNFPGAGFQTEIPGCHHFFSTDMINKYKVTSTTQIEKTIVNRIQQKLA